MKKQVVTLPSLFTKPQVVMMSAVRDVTDPDNKQAIMPLCVDRATAEAFIKIDQMPINGAN